MKLTVCKASAGSGKTYELAKRYISMLVDDCTKYKKILAVTFTNKATTEMKDRIVKNLFLLSDNSNAVNPDTQKEYRKFLTTLVKYREKQNLPCSEALINSSCKKALHLLLNDYSQVAITNIDKFTGKVIRSFAFESHLPATYSTELDYDSMIKEGIDSLMLNMKDDAEIERWLLEFQQSKINDDFSKGWRIESDLLKEATALKHDFIADERSNEEKKNEYNSNIEKLNQITRQAQDFLKKIDDIVTAIGKWDSFSYGKNCRIAKVTTEYTQNPNFMDSLFTINSGEEYYERITDCIEIAHKRNIKKEYQNNPDCTIYSKTCKDFVDFIDENRILYNNLRIVTKRFYALGLLSEIKRHINNNCITENKRLLADMNTVLNKLIGSAPAPYIYEKIGTRIENIMIDEFQDTSTTQWQNFMPLIENSLSQNFSSLVVGDVKQAIYRWRNGDWRLLHDGIEKDVSIKNDNPLNTNWRSSKNVIDFNNNLFAKLPEKIIEHISETEETDDKYPAPKENHLLQDVKNVYNECQQKYPVDEDGNLIPIPEGYVQIVKYNVTPQNGDSEKKEAEKAWMLGQLLDTIKQAIKKGYAYKDCCILIRNRKDGAPIVEMLNRNNIDVITSDSLIINEATSVRIILAYLSLLENPAQHEKISFLVSATAPTDMTVLEMWNSNHKTTITDNITALQGKDLQSAVSQIIKYIPKAIADAESAFIDGLQNMMKNFMQNNAADIAKFVEFVETATSNNTVAAPQDRNAVKLMTIHKSKGLQFPIVMVPFASWDFDVKTNGAIYSTKTPGNLTNVKQLPMQYNKNLRDSDCSEVYFTEQTNTLIDNINIAYVAFTRAEVNLFIWGTESKDKNGEVSSVLKNPTTLYFESLNTKGEEQTAETTLSDGTEHKFSYYTASWGKFNDAEKKERRKPEWESADIESPVATPFATKIEDGQITITTSKDRENSINGRKFHAIMQNINSVNDMERAIGQAEINGALPDEADVVKDIVKKIVTHPDAAKMFSPGNKVLNECNIIAPFKKGSTEKENKRADRIIRTPNGEWFVLDYKFVDVMPDENTQKKYNKQVMGYCNMLNECGIENVKGYLLYMVLSTNQINFKTVK